MDIVCTDRELGIFEKIAAAAQQLDVPCYLIGGFVRDKIIGRSTKDADIVCMGDGIELAHAVASLFHPKPTVAYFKTFGTAQIKLDDFEIEFVGARKESYSQNSRKPEVLPGSLEDDQNRRDFTINALAISLNKADFGTLVEHESAVTPDSFIRGISSINRISLLSLEGSGMVGIPGFSKRLFEALAQEKVNVILITQSSSEHSICVGINEADTDKAKRSIDHAFDHEIRSGKVDPLKVETGQSIVALVGEQMKSHPGISGKMFGVLGRNGINVRAIAQGSSEKNISAVLSSTDVKKAINVLHEEFFETTYKQLNVFIAGTGNVGGKLIGQIQKQFKYLQDHLRLQIQITGLANSKRILINEEGVDLSDWKQDLQQAQQGNIHDFVQQIIRKNLRNSVFVDVTANAEVASVYGSLLEKSVAVVACNKIAASSSYASYKKLKSLSREYNTSFLFETNVGAGLPVIGTLNDLLRSGDQVNRIQAVLSGTLNFVFNHYDATRPFAQVVRQAQEEGYTEPDPRLDLGGTDVMRKIMILAREAGQQLEMEDISNEYFLPASCFEGSVEDFYAEMEKQEAHFQAIYQAAANKHCKLKFVAQYENGKASVGLQHIPADSDFYHLYGKDNLVLFYTERYPEQPLVIKGAGAGADVTASGVFADIIRVAR